MPSEGGHVISVSARASRPASRTTPTTATATSTSPPPVATCTTRPDNTRDITKAVLAAYPESLARVERPARRQWRPDRAERREELQPGRHVRVLPVPAGHVDGVTARGRRGGACRQQVRVPRPAQRRAHVVAGRRRVDHARDGDQDPVSGPARVHVHAHLADRRHGHGDPRLRGVALGQRLLRQAASSTPAGQSATSTGPPRFFSRIFARWVFRRTLDHHIHDTRRHPVAGGVLLEVE